MIQLNSADPSHAHRFHSHHGLHFAASSGKQVVLLTGVAIIDFHGSDVDWTRDSVSLLLPFPANIIPAGKAFKVEQAAPFVTVNALATGAQGAGWAVDGFESPLPAYVGAVGAGRTIEVVAHIAAHDPNSFLIRLGYSLMVTGTLIDAGDVPKVVQ